MTSLSPKDASARSNLRFAKSSGCALSSDSRWRSSRRNALLWHNRAGKEIRLRRSRLAEGLVSFFAQIGPGPAGWNRRSFQENPSGRGSRTQMKTGSSLQRRGLDNPETRFNECSRPPRLSGYVPQSGPASLVEADRTI